MNKSNMHHGFTAKRGFGKSKGFGGLLLVFAIFVAAIFLISTTTQLRESNSMKEQLVESKIVLTNYEINLKQSTLDCNWSKTIDLNTCIDNNANTLLAKENTVQNFLNCTKINPVTTISAGNKYSIDLNCTNKTPTTQNDLGIYIQKTITLIKLQ